MASKLVLDDGKRAEHVLESQRTHARSIAERRAAQYREAKVKGAPTADQIEAVLTADAALLGARVEALRESNKALEKELGDDPAVFRARDAASEALRALLVEVRESISVNCGDGAAAEAGFDGETPRDPVALEELGGTVHASVSSKPPKATRRGVRFDALAAIEGLDEAVAALAKANADVRREKREEQAERQKRDEAWALFDRELSSSRARHDAELRSVGLDALAERIVPSRSARGAKADQGNGNDNHNNGGPTPA